MSKLSIKKFEEKYNVRTVPRTCRTCKHFVRTYGDTWCEHPELMEDIVTIDEGCTCNAWEQNDENQPMLKVWQGADCLQDSRWQQ